MAFYLVLFTPETWDAFRSHGGQVSGFRERYERLARERIKVGDTLLCYLVGLSRWCGALEVASGAFRDETPIFGDPDPYVVRFRVRQVVALDPGRSPPIFEDAIWNHLSETKGIGKGARGWATRFRGSLRRIDDADGALLLGVLRRPSDTQATYPLTERDRRQLSRKRTVRTLTGEVEVEVPDAEEAEAVPAAPPAAQPVSGAAPDGEARESIQVQAMLARIGAQMGFRVWVPPGDRARVLELVPADLRGAFLAVLPVNYDDNTLDTIRQIDVLWLKGRSMARAFEVEHTTAVYSGLLRMADLLALQPNLQIRLHIVAPEERRDKVLREIKRPVFSLLEHGPLYEKCTFLSYDAVRAVADIKHLSHTNDTILDEYEEGAEDE
jgi:hypothetical protein